AGCRLAGLACTAHNVADAGNLVDGLLGLLAGYIQLTQRDNELLDRPESNCGLNATVLRPKLWVRYRHKVNVISRQHIGQIASIARVPAAHTHLICDGSNTARGGVEFVGQLAIDG